MNKRNDVHNAITITNLKVKTMKRVVFILGLAFALLGNPFSIANAANRDEPQKTVVVFENGDYIVFDCVLTNEQIIRIYEVWYSEHPEFGGF